MSVPQACNRHCSIYTILAQALANLDLARAVCKICINNPKNMPKPKETPK